MNEKPRAYTPEELRDLLLDKINVMARYWANLKEERTVLDRIQGAMFSVLSILDGAHGTCTFDLVARTDSSDKQYHIENGENWVEDGTALAFMLHEFWPESEAKNEARQKFLSHKGPRFCDCTTDTARCSNCNCYLGTYLKIPFVKMFDLSKENQPTIIWRNEQIYADCPKCGTRKEIEGIEGHIYWLENVVKNLRDEYPGIEL